MRQALGPGALVGGGIGMGNTCKPMVVSLQCMTKFTTNKKIKIKKKTLYEKKLFLVSKNFKFILGAPPWHVAYLDECHLISMCLGFFQISFCIDFLV